MKVHFLYFLFPGKKTGEKAFSHHQGNKTDWKFLALKNSIVEFNQDQFYDHYIGENIHNKRKDFSYPNIPIIKWKSWYLEMEIIWLMVGQEGSQRKW